MTELNPAAETAEEAAPAPAALKEKPKPNWYTAMWRWHFYGSVIVIPILFILAVTGLTYMYRTQIDSAFHPGVITVEVPANAERLTLDSQEAAVHAAYPDRTILSVTDGSGSLATVYSTLAGEDSRNVYVNPYTGKVTGDLAQTDLVSDWAIKIHGTLLLGGNGGFGDYTIELGVCWAIVLTLTGYYIFFGGLKMRKRQIKARAAGSQTRRVHAWVGAIAGFGILFLVLSGLPWTGFWGGMAQKIATNSSDSLWGADPGGKSDLKAAIEAANTNAAPAGWAIGNAPQESSSTNSAGMANMPGMNGAGAMTTNGLQTITAAQAAEVATRAGATGPYFIMYPDGEEGTYTVFQWQWSNNGNVAEHDVSLEKTIYVDQYSGKVVAQYGYADYSGISRAVSWGIAGHEGRSMGPWSGVNQFITVAFCAGIIFLCISGPIVWWRRRKAVSGIGAPSGKLPIYTSWGLAVLMVGLGIFMPLFGASLIIILLLDQLVIRRIPALKRYFGSV